MIYQSYFPGDHNMSRISKQITATEDDIIILKKLAGGADKTLSLRANIILKCLEMSRNKDVAKALSIDERSVALWKERFRNDGVSGLSRVHGGGKAINIDLATIDAAIKSETDNSDIWTISALSKDLGISEYMVKESLSRQGIQRRRLHSWIVNTSDEVISKHIDIRGLYLSYDTRAIIICSSNEFPLSTTGSFITKNRLLAKDLEASIEDISIADTLVAARKHYKKRFFGKFETFSSFFADVTGNTYNYGHSEWHVFVKTNQEVQLKGSIREDIHIESFETDNEWLSQVKGWIAGTYETSRFDQIGNLFTAIGQFLEICEPFTEPVLWKKVHSKEKVTNDPSADHPPKTSEEHQVLRSVEDLIKKIGAGSSDVQMGALLILKDKDRISLGEAVSDINLPSANSFDFTSRESIGTSIGKAEAPILSFAREMEIEMLRLYIENVKKNKAD